MPPALTPTLESKVRKTVLFLVDRRAQAVPAFASFEPERNKKFDKIHGTSEFGVDIG